jgi:hypothetical protein
VPTRSKIEEMLKLPIENMARSVEVASGPISPQGARACAVPLPSDRYSQSSPVVTSAKTNGLPRVMSTPAVDFNEGRRAFGLNGCCAANARLRGGTSLHWAAPL